ncbi:ATP-grasp fold amidoligase family protein [uncultured Brachyspira sp.]|uniref:ATP-grasp fold amidoligase family protein n=1 Tax=uncultured Brachyspira sp. TaxID=221953 RepID=UPI0025ED7E41|nr:ATP-grasp fold amidoligase family protein [uncultured Brachyspira sp.]
MTVEENIKLKKEILEKMFIESVGYKPNIDEPKTFNEKLNWLKLYYHDPRITKYADKYEVREYIKNTIGEEYLIPLLGVYDNAEDIDFDSLPNQFVLKVNWGSGQNIVVKDKSKLDIEDAKKKLNKWIKMTSNHYYAYYEWGYKNIKPKILCEKFIKDDDNDNLIVYGIYCYSGKPRFIHVITDAHTGKDRCTIYDTNWNKVDVHYIWDPIPYDVPKPKLLDKLLELANKLSCDFPHVRIDFFSIGKKIYSSEITFYTNAALSPFTPVDWDYKFGEDIIIPKDKKIEYEYISREELIDQVTNIEKIMQEFREINSQNNIVIKEQYIPIKKYCIFNLITLFNIDLFSINKTDKYFIITILGIKISLKL